jgi:hypothetical protein
MRAFFQRKGVRIFLSAFKWCRVAVLMVVLLAVAALTYFQLVGMPDFLKKPLLQALRQRGFEAQFTDAHFAWGPSIIIENGSFSSTNETAGPRLSAGLVQLDLNAAALLRRRLHMDSFQVLKASLRIPMTPTNQEPLLLTNVNLRVTLLPNNLARLTEGSAWARGIRIQINGEVRNFLSIHNWKFPMPEVLLPSFAIKTNGPSQPVAPSAQTLLWELAQKIQFAGSPLLKIHVDADGHDLNTLRAELEFSADRTQSPWGQCGPLYFRAACNRLLNTNQMPFFQVRFLAHDVSTPWAAGRDLSASVDLLRNVETNFSTDLNLTGHELSTSWHSGAVSNWIRVADLQYDGTVGLNPGKAAGAIHASKVETGWGSASALALVMKGERTNDLAPDPAWGPWNQIKPLAVDWEAHATNVVTPKLKLDRVAFEGGWHAPQLTVNKLEALMYKGHLNAGGRLDVNSREVQTHASVDFDPHQIAPLLTAPAQHWISLYDWESPPNLSASMRFVLPAWTNRIDVWTEDSQASLQLAGDFAIGRGAFRGIAVTSARSHFDYTNRNWNLSGLQVAVDGGSLDLDCDMSDVTHAYHFRFDSKLDPALALPLLTKPQQDTLHEMSFAEKPEIQGEVWGDWNDPAATGFAASLTAGHFIVRGEKVNELKANVDFTNRFLHISQLSLTHDTGRAEFPEAGIKFASNFIVVTMSNASSTMDPEPVRRALGKIAPSFLQDVHFDTPPTVTASGTFTPNHDEGTDLHFTVQGNRFHWKTLHPDSIQGKVDYHIRTVILTNVQAAFYGHGKAQGWIDLEWEGRKSGFDSDFLFTDVNLAALAKDTLAQNNKIEGMLDGQLALSSPFGTNDTNFFGHGWVRLHNGLLWNIKLFGVFSPILNTIAPGSGESRAREASATFLITNSVLSTEDLEIHSSGFRLSYRGTIDAQKRLNARVEANLLRDTPLFGHFLSWMLTPVDKVFEYRVTGTLNKPIAKPVYIPKLFLDILRPFHSLKEMLPPPAASKTNPEATPAPTPDKPTENPK